MPSLFLDSTSDYAFTEIKTFHISSSAAIENPATLEGQLWSKTIQYYLSCPDTKLLWWGRLLDNEPVVKLIVDWKNEHSYLPFINSPVYHQLQEIWKSLISQEIRTSFYALPGFEPHREGVLNTSGDANFVSVLLTFHFPVSFNPNSTYLSDGQLRAKKDIWQNAWDVFSCAALRSEGGIVSSSSISGWSLHSELLAHEDRSFIGIFRWKSMESFKEYIRSVDGKSWMDGGLEKFKEMATNESELDFARVYCFKQGWLGSVTVTKDHA